jgi:hypothetical protein
VTGPAGGLARDVLADRLRQLVAEGERLSASPSLPALRLWLQLSDDLLAAAWGSMDRYHLAWLSVGRPTAIVRGRPMTPEEEDAYVREVAGAKTAVLRASLDAVDRQGMPFVGERHGVAPGQGQGRLPDAASAGGLREATDRIAEARRAAAAHRDHGPGDDRPRAPRPEKMER